MKVRTSAVAVTAVLAMGAGTPLAVEAAPAFAGTAVPDTARDARLGHTAAAVTAESHSRVFRSTSPGGRAYTSGRISWKENSAGQVYDGRIQGTVWDKASDQRCAYAKIKVVFSSGGGGTYTSDRACKPGHKVDYGAGPDRRISWIGVKACTTDGKCDPQWR
ncbi:hypothetical protein ACGFYV_20680 [Streptomyces sp. NPDC048297]|uniref:hypothetical protein n=1 Tax=Streptomyces sp. NPDC048297 TaxID=3365531 RepID=UPI00371CFC39